MNAYIHKRKTVGGSNLLEEIDSSTRLVLEEADIQGIVWKKISYTNLFKLHYQGSTQYFHGRTPSTTTEYAQYCCRNKSLSNTLLENAGISVNKGYIIKPDDSNDYVLSLYEDLQTPLVVKPTDDSLGNNVYLNISTPEAFLLAIKKISDSQGNNKSNMLVEQMCTGNEYRILATPKGILSVIRRIPANITGDGASTIQELIEEKNVDPIRVKVTTYTSLVINQELIDYLKRQDLTLFTILEKDRKVFLLEHSSLDISSGGDTIDVTDKIHPSVHALVDTIMGALPGLSLAGIDFMTTNIYAKQTSDVYKIIEINSNPNLDWNEYPIVGPRRRVGFEFLKIMFPTLVMN